MPSELEDLQRVLDSYGGAQTVTQVPSPLDPQSSAEAVFGDRSAAASAAQAEFTLSERQREVSRERLIAIRAWCAGDQRIDPELIDNFSRLEQDYCRRVGSYVPQYGYELFERRPDLSARPEGAIANDYVLGIGDQIIVTYRGSETGTYAVTVDREGRVVLPDLPPITAAGLALGDFRRDLENVARASLIGASVFVSVGELRPASIFVVGEVQRPGAVRLSALSTVLDALADAGVKKTGSLRMVRVERGASSYWFDLYEFMELGNAGMRVDIADGDRIIVPLIGPALAIAGSVQRPGIYELAEGSTAIEASRAIALAGGTLRPQGNSIERLRIDERGRHIYENLSDLTATIAAGDVLLVDQLNEGATNSVVLAGHVLRPGMRSISAAQSVSELIVSARGLQDDAYLPLAHLKTRDAVSRTAVSVPVNLTAVFAGRQDFRLRDGDELVVFAIADIAYLDTEVVRAVLETGELPVLDDGEAICPALITLQNTLTDGGSARFGTVFQSKPSPWIGQCPEIFARYPDSLPFLLEQVAALLGEVRRPGLYPTVAGAAARGLITAAGGLTREIDQAAIDLSRAAVDPNTGQRGIVRQRYRFEGGQIANLTIDPGDVVRFNPLIAEREGTIELSGEFNRPGVYEIRRGERLSEVMIRAGGVTEIAYPYGAVFTRDTARIIERQGFERAARELEASLSSAVAKNVDADAGAVQAILNLSTKLRQVDAVGRVVVEADPTVLQVRRDLDIVLEPGDRMHIPKRPGYVTVVGDVLNPGSQQFTPGSNVSEYVQRTGGLLSSADQSHIFVVYPNGAADSVSISAWNLSSDPIPPGSVVVVPRNADPFDAMQLALDLTQILSQVALTAAALAAIN